MECNLLCNLILCENCLIIIINVFIVLSSYNIKYNLNILLAVMTLILQTNLVPTYIIIHLRLKKRQDIKAKLTVMCYYCLPLPMNISRTNHNRNTGNNTNRRYVIDMWQNLQQLGIIKIISNLTTLEIRLKILIHMSCVLSLHNSKYRGHSYTV